MNSSQERSSTQKQRNVYDCEDIEDTNSFIIILVSQSISFPVTETNNNLLRVLRSVRRENVHIAKSQPATNFSCRTRFKAKYYDS